MNEVSQKFRVEEVVQRASTRTPRLVVLVAETQATKGNVI